ncbi:SGNH/GDSL hydrolase family protein [Cohnella hashimotonis]|uniref:GDSL-type esterase/lipase family protein n=1 Tax=Cohnella hashimotonis TaxID=2826895 RepID=A0ABT6TIX3_9BACL|nr:SGNH/GDSL hydrolase family protein [Cohnella hashimotonis]MDI4646664.1 GDSL-type esterase/lipase family protein [Cohnella hashimotonis]
MNVIREERPDVLEKIGMHVRIDGDWRIRVEPGLLKLADGTVLATEGGVLEIRPAGKRTFPDQRYTMAGEAQSSPCYWNTESIRGSGGAPYQRMVPGSLRVRDKSRTIDYQADVDYCFDFYWGTVKRHPHGAIQPGELLLLDYEVWLCRYDAVVLLRDGTLTVVEGEEEAPESRELLLPDPPQVREGYALAHIFTGWGEPRLYDGGVDVKVISGNFPDPSEAALLPRVSGRYLDASPRTYAVELTAVRADGSLDMRIGAEGIDYGLDEPIAGESMRWLELRAADRANPFPLLLRSAYGHSVDWGLRLDLSGVPAKLLLPGACYRIAAAPLSVMNLMLPPPDPVSVMPIDNVGALAPFRTKLRQGGPVRIAFFGESTTRSGRWPYQLARALRETYPQMTLRTSNVAIGGENSAQGALRYADEVRAAAPDLVVLEYMLNDSFLPDGRSERALSGILARLREDGIPCLIVTNNGIHPLFEGTAGRTGQTHDLYRRLAASFGCAFVGGYAYYERLHEFGIYPLTELKGNMINHPFGNVDPDWGGFDEALGRAVIRAVVG